MATHIGTHIDAPAHAIKDGDAVDNLDVNQFVTSAHIIDVDVEPLSAINVDDVVPALDDVSPGDAVVLHTGWEDHIDTETYHQHPYFTQELAEWFVKREISLVGMDFLTPDKPVTERSEGFTFPIHTELLANDVLILENLTNTAKIVGTMTTIVVAPIKLSNVDGAPVRAIAAVPRSH